MTTLFVYILRCSDDTYYTGLTNDLDRRIAEHNEGLVPDCYTWKRRPVELAWVDDFPTPSQAIAVEKQIKGWTRNKKEAMIRDNWDTVRVLAACRNKSASKRLWKKNWIPKVERARRARHR